MLISIQAIQTKPKAVSGFWRYQIINRSNYVWSPLTVSIDKGMHLLSTKFDQTEQNNAW